MQLKVRIRTLAFLFLGLAFSGCQEPVDESQETFLFIGHQRVWEPKAQVIDSIAAKVDLSQFDMVLLGGDVVYESSKDDTVLTYLDSIYDLGNSSTMWALGNHDDSNLDLVSKYTKRPAYYAQYQNGITFLVTYTNDDESSFGSEQIAMIKSVCDTISTSSHLILLQHKLSYLYANSELEQMTDSVPNGLLGPGRHELQPNNFYSDVVPMLRNVEQKGVDVICVAGDLGFRTYSFEHETSDGIQYLASGMNSGRAKSQVLVFAHKPGHRKLAWRFVYLSSMKTVPPE